MAEESPDAALLGVDVTDPCLYERGFPHDLFTELRRCGPVLRHGPVDVPGADGLPFWAVLAHPEIQRANRDWETFSAREGQALVPLRRELRGQTVLSLDPPEHTEMRRQISAGFTPRMVARLEAQIRARTTRILDDAASRQDVDFVWDIAFALPMHVIADIVGIPEADRDHVFHLVDMIVRALDPALGRTAEDRRATERELFAYASELTASKRAHPVDDVWSILANGPVDPLEPLFLTLAGAGSETTRNALAIGLLALLDHPDQFADLAEDQSLVASATEEILRWSSPVIAYGRTAASDVELGGRKLCAGDRVVLFYPSGNRDEDVFADPFRFDIRRSPNPHHAFGGGGPHVCLGASLARSEISVMIGEIARRFPTIEVTGDPVWMGIGPASNVGVGITSLPVRVD